MDLSTQIDNTSTMEQTIREHLDARRDDIEDEDTANLRGRFDWYAAAKQAFEHKLAEVKTLIQKEIRVTEMMERNVADLNIRFEKLNQRSAEMELVFNSVVLVIHLQTLIDISKIMVGCTRDAYEVFKSLLPFLSEQNNRPPFQPILEMWTGAAGNIKAQKLTAWFKMRGAQLPVQRKNEVKRLFEELERIIEPEWFEDFLTATDGNPDEVQAFKDRFDELTDGLVDIPRRIVRLSQP